MSELHTMFVARLRGILVEVATAGVGSYLTVPDIRERIDFLPPRGKPLADLVNSALWQIAEAEHQSGHPMLTALVVKQRQGKDKSEVISGDGFFHCAEKLGIYDPKALSKEVFWRNQFDLVHEYWKIPKTS